MAGAPRQAKRKWRGFARGAGFALALVTASQAAAVEITSARYDGPTQRYPHGVLGDAIEYTTLVVRLSDGRRMSVRWDEHMVFEDLAPRLADLDGDGAPEIITVESHTQRGARLGVWGLKDGTLTQIAATPHIGSRFRWLAPIAWEDLDGDGFVELAYVDRPHLTKVLRVWRFVPKTDGSAALNEVATMRGLTNHRIGWDYISGGTRDCGQGPEIVLADAGWTQIVSVSFDGGDLKAQDLGPYSAAALKAAQSC